MCLGKSGQELKTGFSTEPQKSASYRLAPPGLLSVLSSVTIYPGLGFPHELDFPQSSSVKIGLLACCSYGGISQLDLSSDRSRFVLR